MIALQPPTDPENLKILISYLNIPSFLPLSIFGDTGARFCWIIPPGTGGSSVESHSIV